MSERDLKVTDKRMFTADGELREEYRHLEGRSEPPAGEAESQPTEPRPAAAAEPESSAAEPARPAPEGAAEEAAPRLEFPGTPAGLGAPTFMDLVSLLAEPVALYLGDVELPDGKSAENLEAARLHIDLLDLLRQKTAGNLSAQESAILEDLLYRCRLRYVQKRG